MSLFEKIYNQYLTEAEGALGALTPGPAAAADPAGGMPAPAAAPAPAPAGPAPISPEDNATKTPETAETALVSQKKLQLIKLVAKALNTPSPLTKTTQDLSSRGAPIRQKIIAALQKTTTEENVQRRENLIIKAIAFLQNVSDKTISSEIDYIDPSIDDSSAENYRYIPVDQYIELTDLAKDALLADRNAMSKIDKTTITASDINASNAEEKLKMLQSILSQVSSA
jgi:hypothetical protein